MCPHFNGHDRQATPPRFRQELAALLKPDIQLHSGMPHIDTPHKLNILVASTISTDLHFTENVISRLASQTNISLRVVVHPANLTSIARLDRSLIPNLPLDAPTLCKPFRSHAHIHQTVADLCNWADLLITAPIDADTLARMLHGMTDTLLLAILRSWDVSKKILLVPGMSTLMWENPMTKKQISKIRRKWNWVRVLQPLLWGFESGERKVEVWEGMEELIEAVRNQVDLASIGQDVNIAIPQTSSFVGHTRDRPQSHALPPEIWSMILDYTGDWELAKALHVYTSLPTPAEWRPHQRDYETLTLLEKLEWTILTGTLRDVQELFATSTSLRRLSRISIRLIMRFAMTPLLSWLETNHKDLFWATFGHAFLPDKASSVFGKVELLEYWRTSPTFLSKEYTAEALDGASKAGFVHVLDWWHKSGLPLKYTEAALEQASSKGQIAVLEWWRTASTHEAGDANEEPYMSSLSATPLRLKVGKSICYATQSGSLPTVRWWATSSIPFPHEDTVAKLASTHGHVDILTFWQSLRGEKMIFDNQVLVGATKNGHRDVLEWWKKSGLRVEYKTCDIEEALEDGVEGKRGEEVRRWWARNGLNLGVGTSEWMKTKVLN